MSCAVHRTWRPLLAVALVVSFSAGRAAAETSSVVPARFVDLSNKYCVDCHQGTGAEARLDLAAAAQDSVAEHFADWRRVQRALASQQMPPADGEPLPPADREAMLAALDSALQHTVDRFASDPGPSTIRRLTSAEYDYCLEDLTGLQLSLGDQFVSDSVGGSGFTNSAAAQFMQDATLERYLEAAKIVAEHAMLGAGPLYFDDAPGQTGLELSAAGRIQKLYRTYGFRSAAGEGAEPYGQTRFARAFRVAWQYRFRTELGRGDATLNDFADAATVERKFAQHVWSVLNRTTASFPLADVIATWTAFPAPTEIEGDVDSAIAERSVELYEQMELWQTRFASSASAEEEASVLTGSCIHVPSEATFICRALRKRIILDDNFTPDLNNKSLYSDDGTVRFQLTIERASTDLNPKPVVIFRDPKFRFRVAEVVQPDPVALQSVLTSTSAAALRFGDSLGGQAITPTDFALRVGETVTIEVELPEDCRVGELLVEVELDAKLGRDSVVRCVVQDVTDQRGRSFSSLLRDRNSSRMDQWEAGISEFAEALPQISHREPVPSDRDPIPLPFDNTYNLPERNYFHTAVKYHRDDQFLREHLIPSDGLHALNIAWTDLLTSFDYHNVNLRFTCDKFGIDLKDRRIDTIDAAWIADLPSEAREHIAGYKAEYAAMQASIVRAEPMHVDNALEFAERAWRRPLSLEEQHALRQFYADSRGPRALDHRSAMAAMLARILISPDFLFRVELPAANGEDRRLSPYELASRLSFALWSSTPDTVLLSHAADNSLLQDDVLQREVARMLRSPKSQRLATEFFGQWLGFYQFDRFRGVDVERFPEFDEALRNSLYQEAIALFEHIVREDRPYHEILDADYTFLDQRAAEHYGIEWDSHGAKAGLRMLASAESHHRGGVFGLGAILTATSAPLRTSPVKRGDWILRRIVGTPVPPPPADAGSIPAEDVLADGQTVRQRLDAHRNNAECMSCHVRIDPLGFALENFDSLGRWRDTYRDGQAIDAVGVLASGETLAGLAGLKSYMRQIDDDFRRTFATRLVNYVLGRAETIADAALIDRIVSALELDPRVSTAVLTIAQSPQFQTIRGSQSDESRLAQAAKEAR